MADFGHLSTQPLSNHDWYLSWTSTWGSCWLLIVLIVLYENNQLDVSSNGGLY